ncbi:MAG: alpha/beta hydrolase [Anaeromyxobacter sp.]
MRSTRPGARWGRRTGLALAGLVLAVVAGAGWVAVRTSFAAWRDAFPSRELVKVTGHDELEVSLRSADGVQLSAAWRPARNGAAVVLAHGLHANRDQLRGQAEALEGAGFGVLLLDLRAHGRSGGNESTRGDRERLDVAAAVAFAAAQPGVRPGRLGALGFSIGALAVADEAIDDPRIAAVALVSMAPSAEADIRASYAHRGLLTQLPALWTTEALGVDVSAVRPVDRLDRLAERPVLLVYGAHDEVAPPAFGQDLLGRLRGGGELYVMPGVGHGGWDAASAAALDARVVAFFTRALLAPDR